MWNSFTIDLGLHVAPYNICIGPFLDDRNIQLHPLRTRIRPTYYKTTGSSLHSKTDSKLNSKKKGTFLYSNLKLKLWFDDSLCVCAPNIRLFAHQVSFQSAHYTNVVFFGFTEIWHKCIIWERTYTKQQLNQTKVLPSLNNAHLHTSL